MIQVHLYDTRRRAEYHFEELAKFMEEFIVKATKNPECRIVLNNGIQHYFLDKETYHRWCIGRTYYIDDEQYHSGTKVKTRWNTHEAH